MPSQALGVPRYTEEEITKGLTLCALTGSYAQAARLLEEDENSPSISEETLGRWCRQTKRERYEALRTELMPRIQARAAAASEDVVTRAVAKEAELLEKIDPESLKPLEAAQALRNVSVTAGIANDRVLKLRGMPTQIVEHRDASELLAKVRQRIGEPEAEIVEAEDVREVPAVSGD